MIYGLFHPRLQHPYLEVIGISISFKISSVGILLLNNHQIKKDILCGAPFSQVFLAYSTFPLFLLSNSKAVLTEKVSSEAIIHHGLSLSSVPPSLTSLMMKFAISDDTYSLKSGTF